eukprot:TRINITY_DN6112_c0_g1_i1.p1 TRINITY_DN6112_c0_g1~~TRINITY_DN6112_c0_g1_i1.p1  ORF type:complete len:1004 (+),score=144.94 TRINITY_DN6112_c0_g1_i1:176-3013(+)
MTSQLPRVLVKLHGASGLIPKPNVFACISIGMMGNKCISQAGRAKSGSVVWNEEFLYRVEYDSYSPFLVKVAVYEGHNLGAPTPLGFCQFDLFHDLSMRLLGVERTWAFKLNTQGIVMLSFVAQTDLNFPIMKMQNLDGIQATSSLSYKPRPEIELALYQCIKMCGVKTLQSRIKVELNTFHMKQANSLNPKKRVLVTQTRIFRGYSPYWNERCRFSLKTKGDWIRISIVYVFGKSIKQKEDEICIYSAPELCKLATATESQRWCAMSKKFQGALGIGFTALSQMRAFDALPDPPKSDEEDQKNGYTKSRPLSITAPKVNPNVGSKTDTSKIPSPVDVSPLRTEPTTLRPLPTLPSPYSPIITQSSEQHLLHQQLMVQIANRPVIEKKEETLPNDKSPHDPIPNPGSASQSQSQTLRPLVRPSCTGPALFTTLPPLAPPDRFRSWIASDDSTYCDWGGDETCESQLPRRSSESSSEEAVTDTANVLSNASTSAAFVFGDSHTSATTPQIVMTGSPSELIADYGPKFPPQISRSKRSYFRVVSAVSEEEEYKLQGSTSEEKYKYNTLRRREYNAINVGGGGDGRRRGKTQRNNLFTLFENYDQPTAPLEDGQMYTGPTDKVQETEQPEPVEPIEPTETIDPTALIESMSTETDWSDWDAIHPDLEMYYTESFYNSFWAKEGKESEEEEAYIVNQEEWVDWDCSHPDYEHYYREDLYNAFWDQVAQGFDEPEKVFDEPEERFEPREDIFMPPSPPSPSELRKVIVTNSDSALSRSPSQKKNKTKVSADKSPLKKGEKSPEDKKGSVLERINIEIEDIKTVMEFEKALRHRIDECLSESPENTLKLQELNKQLTRLTAYRQEMIQKAHKKATSPPQSLSSSPRSPSRLRAPSTGSGDSGNGAPRSILVSTPSPGSSPSPSPRTKENFLTRHKSSPSPKKKPAGKETKI